MDKFAQRRDFWNKLREKTNITGKILESMNPEFQEVMDKLRATDERIRSYGHADGIKGVARAAKSFNNRREYLNAALQIQTLHERFRVVAAELDAFRKSINLKHYKFLLDQFDDEEKKQLFGYDPTAEIKLDDTYASYEYLLHKDAGALDWAVEKGEDMAGWIGDKSSNIFTGRGIAMRALEKRFSVGFLKTLKRDTGVMVDRSDQFVNFLLAIFKKLATALAKRKLDQYIQISDIFIKRFDGFHKLFVQYHATNIVPLKYKYEELEKEDSFHKLFVANVEPNKDIVAPTKPPLPPPTITTDQPSPEKIADGHVDFLIKLEQLSDKNDSQAMVNEILSYSEKIEDTDAETSMKLLAIAEGMLDKSAGIFDFLKSKKDEPKQEEEEVKPEEKLKEIKRPLEQTL